MAASRPERPVDLPDYRNPPLNEVVLGIQFDTPEKYHQLFAGDIWKALRENFPTVQEHPPLQPQFETFVGGHSKPTIQIGVTTGATHDRFWFLNKEQTQLIQFQDNRFLMNWRKLEDINNVYPRYENILIDFENNYKIVSDVLSKNSLGEININQCEITYVNYIYSLVDIDATDFIKYLNIEDKSVDEIRFGFRNALIKDEKYFARLYCDLNSATDNQGKEFLRLSFTVRGAPQEPNIISAIEFFSYGRETIIHLFTNMTSDSAHKVWQRIK